MYRFSPEHNLIFPSRLLLLSLDLNLPWKWYSCTIHNIDNDRLIQLERLLKSREKHVYTIYECRNIKSTEHVRRIWPLVVRIWTLTWRRVDLSTSLPDSIKTYPHLMLLGKMAPESTSIMSHRKKYPQVSVESAKVKCKNP